MSTPSGFVSGSPRVTPAPIIPTTTSNLTPDPMTGIGARLGNLINNAIHESLSPKSTKKKEEPKVEVIEKPKSNEVLLNKESIQKYESKIRILSNRIIELEKELKSSKETIKNMNCEFRNIKEKSDTKKKERDDLIKDLKLQKDISDSLQAESDILNSQISQLKDEIIQLKISKDHESQLEIEKIDLHNQNDKIKQDFEKIKIQVLDLSNDFLRDKDELQKEKYEIEKRLEESCQEVCKLKIEIEKQQQAIKIEKEIDSFVKRKLNEIGVDYRTHSIMLTTIGTGAGIIIGIPIPPAGAVFFGLFTLLGIDSEKDRYNIGNWIDENLKDHLMKNQNAFSQDAEKLFKEIWKEYILPLTGKPDVIHTSK